MLITSAAISLSLAMNLGWVPTKSRWQNLPVSYCITPNSTNTDLSAQQQTAAIEQAINYWRSTSVGGNTSCTKFNAVRANYSCTPGHHGGDLQNNISFVKNWSHGSQTLGVTLTNVYSKVFCGQVTDDTGKTTVLNCIADADIVINDRDYTWRTDGSHTDLISVVAHEFGHFLGLNHCNLNNTCGRGDAIMFAAYVGADLRMPRNDDTEGVCALYPAGGTGLKGVGSPCTKANECAENICLSEGYCSQTCGSCPSNYRCEPRNGQSVCVKADQSMKQACEVCSDSKVCAGGGVCTGGVPNPNEGRCLLPCGADNSCADNYNCRQVTWQDGTKSTLCVPTSGDCTKLGGPAGLPGPGQACVAGKCAEGLDCLPTQQNNNLCAAACGADNRCPDNFACMNTGSGNYCIPAVKEGQVCNWNQVCAVGYCLSSQESPNAICYQDCAKNPNICNRAQRCVGNVQVNDKTLSICMPAGAVPSQGLCSCDTTAACEHSCACDPDCSQTPSSTPGTSVTPACSHSRSQADEPLGAALAALAGLALLLWRRRRS